MQPVPLYLLMLVIICFPIWAWLALIRRANKKDEKVISETDHLLPKDISEPVATLIKSMGSNKVYVGMEYELHRGYGEHLYTLSFYDPATSYRFKLFMRYTALHVQTIVPSSECDWMTQDEMEAIWAAWEDINEKRYLKKRTDKRQSVVDMYATKESDNV